MFFRNGFFKRISSLKPEKIPFSQKLRSEMDSLIDSLSTYLMKKGHQRLPIELYRFYRKTDREIMEDIKAENKEARNRGSRNEVESINPNVGTKMVIDQYFR